jgi:hypothetical protein
MKSKFTPLVRCIVSILGDVLAAAQAQLITAVAAT